MKSSKKIIYCAILICLFAGKLTAQEPALIKIDIDLTIAEVDPNIYSAFVEPIRTVVYGSIYDTESPFADENGFRQSFIDLIRNTTPNHICKYF